MCVVPNNSRDDYVRLDRGMTKLKVDSLRSVFGMGLGARGGRVFVQ